MRTLGIDFGERRVGVAVSDHEGILATPLTVLNVTNSKQAVARISEICSAEEAEQIVVGLPLNMNGSSGEMAEKVNVFIAKLTTAVNVPIVTWDERLSTAMVERAMLEADLTSEKRKRVRDKLAAQVILQGYLDSRAFQVDQLPTTP